MGIMMGPVHDVTAEIREHTMKSVRTGTQRELSLSRHMYVREAGADKRGAQLVFFLKAISWTTTGRFILLTPLMNEIGGWGWGS